MLDCLKPVKKAGLGIGFDGCMDSDRAGPDDDQSKRLDYIHFPFVSLLVEDSVSLSENDDISLCWSFAAYM